MYRIIQSTLWTDPKIKKLDPKTKLLFMYLITNPHAHVSGIYYLPRPFIAHETGLSDEEVKEGIETLSRGYLVATDTQNDLIWVINMLRIQGAHATILKSVATQLEGCHKSSLISLFLKHYDTLAIPYRYPTDGVKLQEQEQEKDISFGLISPVSEPPQPKTAPGKRAAKTKGSPRFEQLWAFYDRKGSKPDALREWNRLDPSPDEDQDLWTEIQYAAKALCEKEERKFWPDLERWIKRGKWEGSVEGTATAAQDEYEMRDEDWDALEEGEDDEETKRVRAEQREIALGRISRGEVIL